jgi:hypothetical protein
MWLVAVIAGGSVACVIGACIYNRKQGMSLGASWFTLVAATVFSTGLLLGYFVTHESSPTLATWWEAPLGRVVWQVGGGLLVSVAILLEARRGYALGSAKVWISVAGFVLVGLLLPLNAERDLLAGPRVFEAVALHTEKTHGWRASIGANLRVRADDGSERELELAGWAANDAEDRLERCARSARIRISVLEHLERVLDVRCE